jgi:hypothetical protein
LPAMLRNILMGISRGTCVEEFIRTEAPKAAVESVSTAVVAPPAVPSFVKAELCASSEPAAAAGSFSSVAAPVEAHPEPPRKRRALCGRGRGRGAKLE